jgi:hypothetical protein
MLMRGLLKNTKQWAGRGKLLQLPEKRSDILWLAQKV